jgi:hypothetical protein
MDSTRMDSGTSYHRRRAIWARERAARATDPSAASTFEAVANFWSALADWAERLQPHRVPEAARSLAPKSRINPKRFWSRA